MAFSSSREIFDRLRAREYARLDRLGQTYLDYTGSGLYAASQVREHAELLEQQVFGNPHSVSPASAQTTGLCERARHAVLAFFRADPEEYAVIFTPNASGALKLVGESYPFSPSSQLLMTFDNHNSVNGIREFARTRGAARRYLPSRADDLRVSEEDVLGELDRGTRVAPSLFAYPAQSNFSGVQHPLAWIALAHERGWDVLLDCAAFAPSSRLDLTQHRPDFVSLSFYKMFGYPTGVGCLIARRRALARLRRPWFAGGTIWAATVQGERHRLAADETAFEDGTLNFLSLPAVEIGLAHLSSIGVEEIGAHVRTLTAQLLDGLAALRHADGQPVVRVYGPSSAERRGPTVAFNFVDPTGRIVDERIVEQRASEANISLRTGCFCNPGAGECAFGLAESTVVAGFEQSGSLSYELYLERLGLQSGGAIRASLGIASNEADLERFFAFARSFVDANPETSDLPRRLRC